MASRPFNLEDVLEGLSSALVSVIQETQPQVKNEYQYAKDTFGIDLKRINDLLSGDSRVSEKTYEQAVSAFKTIIQRNPALSPFMDQAIKELGGTLPKGAVDQMQRELSGSAKRIKESPVKATPEEIKDLRDSFIKTLSKMGVRGTSDQIERFLKGKAKKGTLRGILSREEVQYKDKDGKTRTGDYEVIVKDLVLQFVASELRKTVSRGMVTTSKRSNPEQNAREIEEAKKVQAALGKLGFPTSKERGGGRITAEFKDVRSIGLKDPATASFLLGLLFFDDKGKPRKNIASFSGDWGTIVRAIHDTPRGTPLERLQSAIDQGKIDGADKGILRILGRNADNLIKGGSYFSVKRTADGSFDLSGILETYKDPTKFVAGLISSITGLSAADIGKVARETRDEMLEADRKKAERQQKRALARKNREDKARLAQETASAVIAATLAAKEISKKLKLGKVSPADRIKSNLSELDGIIKKLKETDVSGENRYKGKDREDLVAKARKIEGEIRTITEMFQSFANIEGLTPKLKRQIKAAGFDVGVRDSLSKRIESKISQATNRQTGSTTLSTQKLTEIEQAVQTALADAKVSSGTVKTIMANINTPGRIYEIKGDELDAIMEAARLAEAGLKDARETILASLETKALKGRAKTELRRALERATGKRGHGEYATEGSKKTGVNALHNNLALIVRDYVKHAQEVFSGATAEQRGQMVIAFAASMYQFQELERRIIARHLGRDLSTIRGSTLDNYALLPGLTMSSMDPKTGSLVKTSLIRLTGRLSGKPDSGGSRAYTEYLFLSGLLAGEINTSPVSSGANFFRTILGVADPAEQAAEIKKITDQAAASLEDRKAKLQEAKSTKDKEALETIRKILAGDRAAFTDPKEMLKLVSYISSARGGKLTATNFIQSLLQRASDQGKLGASAGDLSKLAGLFKMGADGSISGPGPKALMGAGGIGLVQLADSLRKVLDPKGGDVSDVGKALGETITKSFLEGGDLFKKVATKKLEKTLTDAATETAAKLEKSQAARAKREARAAAGPRVRTTRAKLGELTKNEAGEFVDSKGLPLGFKDRGFKAQGIPPAGAGALASYLVKQGLIEKPEDLVMSKGGRGTKPLIDLSASKFVSDTAKEIAGIVQDVRAKAMKIDPTTGGKLAAAAAGSLTDLVKGKGFESGATGKKAREAFNAAVDAAMQDATVKRSFTKGGVKQEQTAPEFLKSLQDQAAAKGKTLTPRAARAKFLKTFKGDAATAVASRLGVDVGAGGDAGKAIVGKLTQQQQDAADAKAAAKIVKDLRRKVLARQAKLGRMAQGPEMTRRSREQYAQAIPFQQRMAAYDRAGLRGAPIAAAGGIAPSAPVGGQGMQFVPGATIAIPQVDIGPLKELASQMAEVGKSLALIPKATIPKGMSASLKEIASLMQVLATIKSPPRGTNVAAFKKLIQDLNSLSSAFGGKSPNTKNIGNIVNAIKAVNKILDALSSIGTKTPAKTLLANMQEFRKSLSFIPKMFSTLGGMDFAAISNIGATIASTKFPSQQRLAGINEALLMIKQILETANGMKGGRMPTITGGGTVGGGGVLGRIRGRVYARQEALAQRIQGPGFGRYGRRDRFGARSIDAVRAIPLRQRLDYYDQIRTASAGGGQRPPRERPVRAAGGGGGNRFGGGRQTAPAGQFGVPRQIGGPMGPQISTGGVQQFANDSMGILGNLAQQIRFGFTQEITREIAQSFGRVLAHLKDGIIKFNSTLETATVAFQTLFENEQKAKGMEVNFAKAKEEAENLVEAIKKFANVTPFRFPQLAESARRMRAFGFETAEIMPNMQAIGDAVAALGGEDDKIFRITYALGQMRQAGRVYQNDMMQLANAGIAGYDILSKALLQDFVKMGQLSISHNGKVIDSTTIQTEKGYNELVTAINAATQDATRDQVTIAKSSSSEISAIFKRVAEDPIEAIRDLTQSGQIAGGAASSAIIEGLGQEYGGGMKKLSKTFEGAFSTLADVTQAFVSDITRPVFNSIRDEMINLGDFLQSLFVARIVRNVASGFEKIVGPVQEVIGSIYRAISSVITGIIQLFGEFSGAFNLMDNGVIRFVNGVAEIRRTFEKTTGAGQEFIARIGDGLKVVADLLQFSLAKGLVAAAVGVKLLSAAWNANPLLLTLTAITISLSQLKEILSSEEGSGFARMISGIAGSLTELARSFKQKIMPLLSKIMEGIGSQFFVSLLATFGLMIPILQKLLALINTLLELINALPFVPDVLGLVAGFMLMKKMFSPLGQMLLGKPASFDARGNPIAATKGIVGTLESGINKIAAKLLPFTTLVDPAGKIVAQRGAPQIPVGTLGKLGVPTGFGAIPGNLQKVVVPASEKKMLSSRMLKQLLEKGIIRFDEYKVAMEARRAAMEAAANAGTGPGGISGLRKLAQTGGGRSAALKALGGGYTESPLGAIMKSEGLRGAFERLIKVFKNLKALTYGVNKIEASSNVIKALFKAVAGGAKAIPKSAVSAISKMMRSFVLASALKFNSSVFSLVPKVFVPFMDAVKATGARGTGGDIVGSVRRAASAGVSRAGRLALAGAQVPFAMPRQGVTGGPLGYLVRAIRGFRPNRLPFEAPGGVAGAVGQRIRPQVLGGSPSMYGVSIFKVIQERIKYITGKVADTAGLYAARITTAFERSFMAFHRMMIRLAGAPARIFTMQNFDKVITRYAEMMVRAFTPKTAPIAGFLAGGTKKVPTELFAGLKNAIARMVIPNTLVGAPKPTLTDKIFTGADKLARISERFAEIMVKGFAPKTVPVEKFLAGGTVRAPKELFTGLKDAIARIVIPNKFTEPISIFDRAVAFFKSSITRFGSFVNAIRTAISGAGGGLASIAGKAAGSVGAGAVGLAAAFKNSRGMQALNSGLKSAASGIKTLVGKVGLLTLGFQGIVTAMTIQERMKSEKNNEGAILAQEGAGFAGSIGGFLGAKALGAKIGGGIGTFLGGPFGTMIGMALGGAVSSLVASFIFPNREVTPAEQEREAKLKAIDEYYSDYSMEGQEFFQLLQDFDFEPIELLDIGKMPEYHRSVENFFDLIKSGTSSIIPTTQKSLDFALGGLGDEVFKVKDKKSGTTFMSYLTDLTDQIRGKMAKFYQNIGKSPAEALILAQIDLAKKIADMGQFKTLEDAMSAFSALARGEGINPESVDGYGLFIGGLNSGLEKLQTNLEKVRSEFQKLASRLQSRVNAVFEQQMAKALEKAKDAFLATQIVMVDGMETNILALREEIEATEKRNKLLAIEKRLREAARSVEMAKLGQYDASMDPLEAAARMREAQEAQTEAVKEAALERKKIALEEAMASDPVVAGLENVDERFEAARMKFQEGMEDIIDLVEAGKLTGTQAAAKIKELYTTTLGEVGVLDANLDVDAQNFGDSFLNTWDTILKKFTAIVTKLKAAIAAVANYKPPANPPGVTTDDGLDTAGKPNDESILGGRAKDNYLGFGISFDKKLMASLIEGRMKAIIQVLNTERNLNMSGQVYTDEVRKAGYAAAINKTLNSLTSTSGELHKMTVAAKSSGNGQDSFTANWKSWVKRTFTYFDPYSGKTLPLKQDHLTKLASGGEVMGVGGMFQVGETGRETLQVVPGGVARIFPRRIRPINQIGMAGGSGGGINASVIINNPTVRSDQDIRKLADAVGKAQSSLLRSAGIGRI